jgi:hypothetical protein
MKLSTKFQASLIITQEKCSKHFATARQTDRKWSLIPPGHNYLARWFWMGTRCITTSNDTCLVGTVHVICFPSLDFFLVKLLFQSVIHQVWNISDVKINLLWIASIMYYLPLTVAYSFNRSIFVKICLHFTAFYLVKK